MTGFANGAAFSSARVLIALGTNLPGADGAPPAQVIVRTLQKLALLQGSVVLGCSGLWRTEPVPPSAQPWYLNAVVLLGLQRPVDPVAFLQELHRMEAHEGRLRGAPNAARSLDLDLLDLDGMVRSAPDPVLPHPRMTTRAFVLLPLAEAAPGWVDPVSGQSVEALIAALPPCAGIERLAGPPLLVHSEAGRHA